MRRLTLLSLYGFLLAGLLVVIPLRVHGYSIPPQVITGDPAGPYIADKKGTGFCGSSRQAKYLSINADGYGNREYDAGNVFGSESSTVPRACYNQNVPEQGTYMPRFLNCFFDGGFFPAQAGSTIRNEKYPRQLFVNGQYFVQTLDFSIDSNPLDKNGDFSTVEFGNTNKGQFFPVQLGANGKNFDPDANVPQNRYRDLYWMRTYPETRNTDIVRDTAVRFRAFLNVPPEWVNKQVVFGFYGDDALSMSIYDKNRKQYIIASAAGNRCEPCDKEGAACLSDNPTGGSKKQICKNVKVCFSNSECSPIGTCDLSIHSCRPNQCTLDSDCGPAGSGKCDPVAKTCVINRCTFDSDCGPLGFGKCDLSTNTCANLRWCQPCDLSKTGMRWRITNHVLFTKPGLYPIEILHVQYTGNAALEVSYRVLEAGESFNDIHDSWGFPLEYGVPLASTYFNAHSIPLSSQNFKLLDSSMLFQTPEGEPLDCQIHGQCSIQDISQCNDPRFHFPSFQDGTLGCKAGTQCNNAGLCQPCATKDACGETCEVCKGNKGCFPVNNKLQCAECGQNSDCSMGKTCQNGQCICTNDNQCGRGTSCKNNRCEPCNTNLSCGGNSCGCCSGTANKCVALDASKPDLFSCVECQLDKDCSSNPNSQDKPFCDTVNHRCVEKPPSCNTDKACGEACKACPNDRPYCLNGQVCVVCRADSDCGSAEYCLNGRCAACTTDKKCGAACRSCTKDAPFCSSQGDGKTASCVGCFKDEQCGKGGTCDPNTHLCQNSCSISCPNGQVCQGDRCVQCVSSAQCGCGQSCDLATNSCVGGCQDSSDCLADECCSVDTHQCGLGFCPMGVHVQGGSFHCSTENSQSAASTYLVTQPDSLWKKILWAGWFLGTVILVLVLVRRRFLKKANKFDVPPSRTEETK